MAARFQEKIVFVTGAGSGFGRAAARAFAREGAVTVILVDRLEDRLDAARGEIEALGARGIPILADLADISACENSVQAALDATGRLDIVLSNHAAMAYPTPFVDLTDEAWTTELNVNLTSSFVIAQRAARSMIETGGGVILFTASVNSLGAGRGFAPYCASKTGLVALVRVMAVELAEHGIRVNCVSPGPADTQRSVDLVGERRMERFRHSFPAVPMNRLASAEDIAEAFLYLASDAAGYVTGQNLIVDGGLTAQIYDAPE